MKKFVRVVVLLWVCLGLVACGGKKATDMKILVSESGFGDAVVENVTMDKTSNGSLKFTVDYTAPKGRNIAVFDPPEGNKILVQVETVTTGNAEVLEFDIPTEYVGEVDEITINFYGTDDTDDYIVIRLEYIEE